MSPTNMEVANKAIEIWGTEYPSYAEMDCQKFVEESVNRCGGNMDYRGSNDMARNGIVWMGTIENARAQGKLVPGAGLMIHEDDESGLPARYKGDGLGDFNHVGFYLGDELAIEDFPKGGIFRRKCDAIHSSQSMGRVAGSTLQNGWTHVVWFKDIHYGEDVMPGVTLGVDLSPDFYEPYDKEGLETENAPEAGTYDVILATVYSDNGKPVALRAKPSTTCTLYWARDVGTEVEVLEKGATWCKVRSRSRVGYMMTKFLRF